jgi:hypothetical protein
LGVPFPSVRSGFPLVVLKRLSPILKATAAIPNASRFEGIKNSGEVRIKTDLKSNYCSRFSNPFFVILNELLGGEESLF